MSGTGIKLKYNFDFYYPGGETKKTQLHFSSQLRTTSVYLYVINVNWVYLFVCSYFLFIYFRNPKGTRALHRGGGVAEKSVKKDIKKTSIIFVRNEILSCIKKSHGGAKMASQQRS